MQDARISFRAGAPLAEALAQCAERAGCSISEYLRAVVRDHVGLSDPPPPINIVADPSAPIFIRAGRGDSGALSELAAAHYACSQNGAEPHLIGLARAVDYARLAVGSRCAFNFTEARPEWLNLLFLLDQYGSALRGAGYGNLADSAQGEAVAYAEGMAQEGDDEMADMVANSAAALSPGTMAFARNLIDYANSYAAGGGDADAKDLTPAASRTLQ